MTMQREETGTQDRIGRLEAFPMGRIGIQP
jgi:hypothetical protein